MLKLFSLFVMVLIVYGFNGCSSQPCKIEERSVSNKQISEKPLNAPKDLTSRVRVYKPDGSLQCGQGKKTDLKTMASELTDIEVLSSENKHDGLMRIQICGHPTGTCNVYEILEADLEKAIKLGFKKWIRD